MEKLGKKIWKGSRVMATDAVGMVGGAAMLWQPISVDLMEWRANQFSLMANFNFLETGAKGSLVNVYGPSTFPQKQAFLDFMHWIQGLAVEGNRFMGGDFIFNLITSLREKKGGRHVLDKYQQAFKDFLSHN